MIKSPAKTYVTNNPETKSGQAKIYAMNKGKALKVNPKLNTITF